MSGFNSRVLAILALCLGFGFACLGQDEYTVPKLEDLVKIPPSPEAQAFAKFGNTPVNLFSGTPDISIPIYTIQGREFSVPVTLTYDASGIKIDQTATWAGLGWNLTVGGMITRQVRGKPDDYLTSNPGYTPFYEATLWEDFSFMRDFSVGSGGGQDTDGLVRYFQLVKESFKSIDQGNTAEIQQDVYSLSGPGLSGTLYINYETGQAFCMDHPEYKVEYVPATGATLSNIKIGEWRITDEQGNYFVFDAPEVTDVDEQNSYDGARSYTSAWGLTRIESKNKRDTIQFSYGSGAWLQPRLAGRSAYRVDYLSNNSDCGTDDPVNPALEPIYKIDQIELSSISLNGTTILTIDPKSRLDLEGKGAIGAISITDPNGGLVKKVKFVHSYFTNGSPQDENDYRLKLDLLEIFGSDTTLVPQQYRFDYNGNGGPFPARDSFAQDFWGYYNGTTSNNSLIPYNYVYDASNVKNYGWQGADRRPNPAYSSLGTLRSIQYPTGGKTEFTYEANLTSEIASNSEYPEYVVNFGMTGGTQQNNVFHYTDDVASPSPGFPMGISGFFTVSKTGTYELKMSLSGPSEPYVPGWAFAVIFRYGDEGCIANSNCDYGAPLLFDEINSTILPWGMTSWLFYGGLGYSMSNTVVLDSLKAGTYQYLLLNTDSHTAFNAEITSVVKTESHVAGGLRISEIVDSDETGSVASTRRFYYGDLSYATAETINEVLTASEGLQSGALHGVLDFEESKFFQRLPPDPTTFNPDFVDCWRTTRYSSNRTNADQIVTYPVVTEVQFDGEGEINGLTVSEFATGVGVSRDGYQKGSLLNGKLVHKRIYDSQVRLLTDEQSFYSEKAVDSGAGEVTGFYFTQINNKKVDLYVKSPIGEPSNGFVEYKDVHTLFNVTGSFSDEAHCWDNGAAYSYYPNEDAAYAAWNIANNAGLGPSSVYQNTQGSYYWWFAYPVNTVYECFDLGGEVTKSIFLFPRRWVTLDSTSTTQFYPQGNLTTVRKSFYENTGHFQVTRVEQQDSKGINHKIEIKYPHEMADAESNTIWDQLVSRHQIAEQIQVTATYGSSSPDFKKKTEYSAFANGSGYTRYLPDTIKMSSGNGSLEARIKYHAYDQGGNPLEIARFNDAHTAYIWGYDKTYPVASIVNATSGEVFYNSFEYDPDLGNSSDSHTGLKCKTGGYSKTLSGLTANKAYTLNYWSKDSGVWRNHTVSVSPSTSSYNISLSGQVDDVRFHPANSKMTSYTYKPLVGITSVSDPNNQPVFYEYDSFGRLVVVRDAKGQIVKTQVYQYFNPDQPVADNH